MSAAEKKGERSQPSPPTFLEILNFVEGKLSSGRDEEIRTLAEKEPELKAQIRFQRDLFRQSRALSLK